MIIGANMMVEKFVSWATTYQGEQTLALIVIGAVFVYVFLFWMNYLNNSDCPAPELDQLD